MGEEDGVESRRRFFKIMLPGFEERLKLPPAFCEKVKNEKSKGAILESCLGRWEMSVCRNNGDGQMMLEDGWPGFVQGHGLSLKDFLVFEHTAKLHFNVMVYDVSGCLKKFPIHHNPNYAMGKAKENPVLCQSPCFSIEISPSAVTKTGIVNIPAQFVKSNNLRAKKGAILKDPKRGRRWRVKLHAKKTGTRLSGMIILKWHDYVASNEVKAGDICTFELVPTSTTSTIVLFHVHISRSN